MLTGIFDSHAHYDDAAFDADRELLLQMLPQQGICAIMNIGCSIESARQSIALAKNFPYIYTAIGIHPEFAAETTERELAEIRQMIDDEQVYAVGEIGLDYHYGKESVQAQKKIFDAQMQLAAERKLPVVIHSRDAAADTMEILRQYPANGVIHCFGYSAEVAQEFVQMGYYIGFTGVLTFTNARKPLAALAKVPLNRLLLETDCPYMAPVPNRGKRCDSSMLPLTVAKMAEIQGVSEQEIVDHTRKNACRLFGIML